MKLIADLLVSAISLYITSKVVSGIHLPDFFSACVAVVIMGLINFLIKPILVFFTLPITILTLGLFMFVINALIFLLVSHFTPGFTIDSFWAALIASLLYSIINSLLHKISKT